MSAKANKCLLVGLSDDVVWKWHQPISTRREPCLEVAATDGIFLVGYNEPNAVLYVRDHRSHRIKTAHVLIMILPHLKHIWAIKVHHGNNDRQYPNCCLTDVALQAWAQNPMVCVMLVAGAPQVLVISLPGESRPLPSVEYPAIGVLAAKSGRGTTDDSGSGADRCRIQGSVGVQG